jgi:amino acid transporter
MIGGVVVTLGYIGGTTALLTALPSASISGLGGLVDAFQQLSVNLHLTFLLPWVALLITLSSVGAAGAYLSATARLPFVAGIDRFLPASFGKVHPKWKTPYVSIISYALAGILFAFLGQAGTSVRGAYNVLVSMAVITYFIPYAFLFLAMIRFQFTPREPDTFRVPGGKAVAIVLASMGLLTTLVTIVLSVFPSPDEVNKPLAVVKSVGLTLILLVAGAVVYYVGVKRGAAQLPLEVAE